MPSPRLAPETTHFQVEQRLTAACEPHGSTTCGPSPNCRSRSSGLRRTQPTVGSPSPRAPRAYGPAIPLSRLLARAMRPQPWSSWSWVWSGPERLRGPRGRADGGNATLPSPRPSAPGSQVKPSMRREPV
jgi:hypothetical protein